jgi:hypothetical protein
MLEDLLESDYEFITNGEFARRVRIEQSLGDKTVVLRHDVDTDPNTALSMLGIEQGLGVVSSYFFRLSTIDFEIMSDVDSYGSEASYHYEEVADFAKQRGLRSRAEITPYLPDIRGQFSDNLTRLRQQSGLPMTTVASHGDFVNRIIGMRNYELLDANTRGSLGIEAEVYDEDLQGPFTLRFSDRGPPSYWSPYHPRNIAGNGPSIVYILVHPKHWYARIEANLRELRTRIGEGLSYAWRSRRK